MNTTADTGTGTGAAVQPAQHISGAHLLDLLGIDPFVPTALRDIVPDDRADLIVDWHDANITLGDGFTDWRTGTGTRNPMVEDILVIVTDHVAETLASHGVEPPTRDDVRTFARADAASGGLGIDPDTELMRARDLVDPDLDIAASTTIEKRINGVPETVYNGLSDPAKKLVIEGKVIASPQAPAYVANWLLRKRFSIQFRLPEPSGSHRRRRAWMPLVTVIDGVWYQYAKAPGDQNPRWIPLVGHTGMRALIRHHLDRMYYLKGRTEKGEVIFDVIKGWTADTKALGEVEAALADMLMSRRIGGTGTAARELPDIYGTHYGVYKGGTRALVRNGVLDLDTGQLDRALPLWFSLPRVEADYDHRLDPDGPEITDSRWMAVLLAQWWDDPGAIACLQEWFGYVISGEINLQRMMWLYGPQGSGKSLITAVLKALMGNTVSLSLEALNDRFGLAEAYQTGATLGMISDSRFAARDSSRATNRVLNITSGIDPVEIEAKYTHVVTTVLPLRLHGTSNNLPNLSDHTGALPGRLLQLKTNREFRGTDDDDPHILRAILHDEMGLVLRWAAAGLARLRANGTFTLSKHAVEHNAQLRTGLSNVAQFLDECVELGDNGCHARQRARHRDCDCDWVLEVDLYHVWDKWAHKNGSGSRMSKIKLREALSDTTRGFVGYGQTSGAAPGEDRRFYGIKSARVIYYERDRFGKENIVSFVAENRGGRGQKRSARDPMNG